MSVTIEHKADGSVVVSCGDEEVILRTGGPSTPKPPPVILRTPIGGGAGHTALDMPPVDKTAGGRSVPKMPIGGGGGHTAFDNHGWDFDESLIPADSDMFSNLLTTAIGHLTPKGPETSIAISLRPGTSLSVEEIRKRVQEIYSDAVLMDTPFKR